MGKDIYYLLLLLWLSYLLCTGIYIFSKGFLLSRQAQNDVNTCIKLKNSCDLNGANNDNVSCENKK